MVKVIAEAVVVRAEQLPIQYVSLNNLISGTDAFKSGHGAEQGQMMGPCWYALFIVPLFSMCVCVCTATEYSYICMDM